MLAKMTLKGLRAHPEKASDARARSANTSKSCNPPRFERRSAAYKCITAVLQHAGRRTLQAGGRFEKKRRLGFITLVALAAS
jgi:hypothetical protein